MKRSCGILLSISSLPSPYGIGSLGKSAYDFVDFLVEAGQSWWQMLPVGPTSYGDSPYQSFSTFAGNPYFIDLETLEEQGLLKGEEYRSIDWESAPDDVNYGVLYEKRYPVLRRAAERFLASPPADFEDFCRDHAFWLEDYALFMALKDRNGGEAWLNWPEQQRNRDGQTLDALRRELAGDLAFWRAVQYLFFAQWRDLRAYANERGIQFIGDLPIYVAMDSADVWADPESFQLDDRNVPVEVSGVPPDYFSENGQLWGNPLYDWDAMKKDGYAWWVRRIEGASHLYDVLRIDHFRGLESYWAVPFGETTAKIGRWVKGPGMDLMNVLTARFPNLSFIAEDLGYLTPEVHQLLKDSGLPGMKILEFAFDSREPSNYLPHTYSPNCVCYAGTHDNAPIMAWREEAAPEDIALAVRYLGLNEEEGFNWGMIRGGMSSVADLFVVQMQDYLGLGAQSRMNTPGILGGNWQWRMKEGQIDQALTEKIAETARIYGRSERAWQA